MRALRVHLRGTAFPSRRWARPPSANLAASAASSEAVCARPARSPTCSNSLVAAARDMRAGGLFGAVISARLVRKYGSARAMLICRILLTFALLLPLTTRGIGLIFSVGWFVVTVGTISGNVISLSFRQARCPAQMLGRISASYYTMTYSSMALGTVFGGALGALIGVRAALWVTCGIVASASFILFFSPIRHLADLPEPAVLAEGRLPVSSA